MMTVPMMNMRTTLPLVIGPVRAITNGKIARSANRSMRLPGRITDSRMAIGTSSSEAEITDGWPIRMAESRPM